MAASLMYHATVGSIATAAISRTAARTWQLPARRATTSAPARYPRYDGPAALDAGFYAALWIGALVLAAGAAIDALPAELDDLAEQFLRVLSAGGEGVAGRLLRGTSHILHRDMTEDELNAQLAVLGFDRCWVELGEQAAAPAARRRAVVAERAEVDPH